MGLGGREKEIKWDCKGERKRSSETGMEREREQVGPVGREDGSKWDWEGVKKGSSGAGKE